MGRCSGSVRAKMIPRSAFSAGSENCTSERHRECPVYREHPIAASSGRCPYLVEPLTQYCSAAPVVKYIPYSESLLSRCGNDGYRYCEAYLALANAGARASDRLVSGIRVPAHLDYAPNHMWFDAGGGRWHAGIDGLLAQVLGPVERIRFERSGAGLLSACLTAQGHEVEVGFPYPLPNFAPHDHLRAKPELLTADPYGQGWLFEGEGANVPGLIASDAAAEWMRGEVERLSEFLGLQPAGVGPATCCDGGILADGVLAHLAPERIRALFAEFFPIHPKWEIPS